MSFEDELRSTLHHDAETITLPARAPSQAADRARARHRRRVATTGVVAVAALVAAAPVVLRGHDPARVAVNSGAQGAPLAATGPLELDWKSNAGGLSANAGVPFHLASAGGAIYALSTGPGARAAADGTVAKAVYRLDDDGTWHPTTLDGARPRASDLAGGGDLLYAVSTGPAAGGATGARLSASSDGGETWTTDTIDPIADPSPSGRWERTTKTSVESNGTATLALVSTSFSPALAEIFPELTGPAPVTVQQRAAGLALVAVDESKATVSEKEARRAKEAATATTAPAVTTTSTEPTGAALRIVPWSELGISGPADLAPVHQLFRRVGTAWAPLAEPAAMAGVDGVEIVAAGRGFVATGWSDAGANVLLTSPDGASWTRVDAPGDGQVVALDGALVDVPWTGNVVHESFDGGHTWQAVGLGSGVPADANLLSAAAGPVGVAMVVTDSDGRARSLVTSSDLGEWTVTPLTDIVGAAGVTQVEVAVGADRVVVTGQRPHADISRPGESVTAVGTPVRHR